MAFRKLIIISACQQSQCWNGRLLLTFFLNFRLVEKNFYSANV